MWCVHASWNDEMSHTILWTGFLTLRPNFIKIKQFLVKYRSDCMLVSIFPESKNVGFQEDTVGYFFHIYE